MRRMKEDLLQLFPEKKRPFWKKTAMEQDKIEEIRLRAGKPVCIRKSGREWYLDAQGNFLEGQQGAYCTDEEEMEAMLQHICHYSLYAFEDELSRALSRLPVGIASVWRGRRF